MSDTTDTTGTSSTTGTTGQPLTPANIKTINQLPTLAQADIDPADVILVQDVSANAYKKSSLQAVVDKMNPLESVNVTRAQYTAKGDTVLTDGVYYNITDDSPPPYQLYFNIMYPIGSVYEQLPPTLDADGVSRTPLDPNTLFNNGNISSTWKKLDYGGAFFRSDGGNASVFGTGEQGEQLPNVRGIVVPDTNIGINNTTSLKGAFTKGAVESNANITGYRGTYTGYKANFSASNGQTNADGTYKTADESTYVDGGEVRPTNYTVIKWIRTA